MLEIAFYGFGFLGFLGASLLVAFAADVIQVITLHLHMCHVLITTVVHGLKLCTSTLWNLFQGMIFTNKIGHNLYIQLELGKCHNQLCKRNDKWSYEMDHLVLGTIFFTLATFLTPTIFIYQAFFSIIENFLYISLNTFDILYCRFL